LRIPARFLLHLVGCGILVHAAKGAVSAVREGLVTVRIETMLSEAQNGQAFANLAQAFHLPPEKVEVAVGTMVADLTDHLERSLRARRSLAALVELLGQSGHEQVLDSPMLLSATHTQVIGNDALKVIAGHDESQRMAQHAASVAGVSEMIAEYLLPAVTAMLFGALAKASRPGLEHIMGNAADGADPISAPSEANPGSLPLPLVAGGVGFSGSTGGTVSVAGPTAASSHYLELAEEIRRADRAAATPDPAEAVRRTLEPILGLPPGPFAWIHWIAAWSTGTLNAILAGWRR
jgi:hypothetical protein